MPNDPPVPRWMTVVLLLAGVYNLVWGAAVVAAPRWWFEVAGMEIPRYPAIWQCVGMIVGVYGVGYLAAASNPIRHWPIVLVGFLGKVFGPIGFVWAAGRGEIGWSLGFVIVGNDLVWWLPFGLILHRAARVHLRLGVRPDGDAASPAAALAETRTAGGETLAALSHQGPLLVVFLRHFGCTFCREALDDVRRRRADIERDGAEIVLVHMSPPDSAARHLARDGLDDLAHVSDPERRLYRAFGLERGSPGQLFGPFVFWRAIVATLRGHLIGPLAGDGLQMPGAFLVRDGRVVRAFRHRSVADRPDYCALASAEGSPEHAGPAAGSAPVT